jgi:hypothetical protein
MSGIKKYRNLMERLWDKSVLTPSPNPNLRDFCWVWLGSKTGGYGQISVDYRPWRLHRFVYETLKSSIPDGKILDHLCRVRTCWNPNHLELVTNKENVLRGIGVTAINAAKTHCHMGHLLAGGNLIENANRRNCRTCKNERQRERRRSAARGETQAKGEGGRK